jgi:hypothetical protein
MTSNLQRLKQNVRKSWFPSGTCMYVEYIRELTHFTNILCSYKLTDYSISILTKYSFYLLNNMLLPQYHLIVYIDFSLKYRCYISR